MRCRHIFATVGIGAFSTRTWATLHRIRFIGESDIRLWPRLSVIALSDPARAQSNSAGVFVRNPKACAQLVKNPHYAHDSDRPILSERNHLGLQLRIMLIEFESSCGLAARGGGSKSRLRGLNQVINYAVTSSCCFRVEVTTSKVCTWGVPSINLAIVFNTCG